MVAGGEGFGIAGAEGYVLCWQEFEQMDHRCATNVNDSLRTASNLKRRRSTQWLTVCARRASHPVKQLVLHPLSRHDPKLAW